MRGRSGQCVHHQQTVRTEVYLGRGGRGGWRREGGGAVCLTTYEMESRTRPRAATGTLKRCACWNALWTPPSGILAGARPEVWNPHRWSPGTDDEAIWSKASKAIASRQSSSPPQ